jgi:arsenate reductase
MKRILFVCTGNSCRSQMAEGFARALLLPVGWKACSAGTRPGRLNPNAVKVMAEAGIDISGQYSKELADINDMPDVVVTLCDSAREEYPVIQEVREVIHWGIEDPFDAKGSEEEVLDVYRRVRDEIRERIENLKKTFDQQRKCA